MKSKNSAMYAYLCILYAGSILLQPICAILVYQNVPEQKLEDEIEDLLDSPKCHIGFGSKPKPKLSWNGLPDNQQPDEFCRTVGQKQSYNAKGYTTKNMHFLYKKEKRSGDVKQFDADVLMCEPTDTSTQEILVTRARSATCALVFLSDFLSRKVCELPSIETGSNSPNRVVPT